MIYLLTALVLSPGGSSTVHIYRQTIHRTTQNKTIQQFGRVRDVPRLGQLYPGICLTTEEKARKNLSQGSRVQEYIDNNMNTQTTIRIHRLTIRWGKYVSVRKRNHTTNVFPQPGQQYRCHCTSTCRMNSMRLTLCSICYLLPPTTSAAPYQEIKCLIIAEIAG